MSKSEDSRDARSEDWSFDDIIKFGQRRARQQRHRFQEYLTENDPALDAAFKAEAKRFDIVSRAVIEPTMQGFAEEVRQRGWHASVVRDDDLDRLALFATPGIRFYCSRRPTHSAEGAPLWPPCFVGFFGSVRNIAVGTHVELSWLVEGVEPSSEPLLQYPEVTNETVRAVLVAFLGDLERLG